LPVNNQELRHILLNSQGFAGINLNPKYKTDRAESPSTKLNSMTSGLFLPSFFMIQAKMVMAIRVPVTQKQPIQRPYEIKIKP